MKPQKQLHRHRPPTAYGDCFRTAVAIVLDMDAADVPHVMDKAAFEDPNLAQDAMEAWLNARGLTMINVVFPGETPLQAVLDHIASVNAKSRVVFLLAGRSRNGTDHVVVCCNGDIVCDPAIDNSGIIGPCEDGYYWVTFFGSLQGTDGEAKHKRDAQSARDRLDAAASLLSADLIAAGMKRGEFYITIGDGELHVYAKAEALREVRNNGGVRCVVYPIAWHVADVDVRPVETEATE